MDAMTEHWGIWLSQYEKPFSDNCLYAPISLPTEPIQSSSNGRCTDSHVGPLTFLQTICSSVSLCFAKLRPPSEVQIEPERGSVFNAVKNRQGEKKNKPKTWITLQYYNANLPHKCVLFFWMCSSWTGGKITTKDRNDSLVDIVSHLLVVVRKSLGYYIWKASHW